MKTLIAVLICAAPVFAGEPLPAPSLAAAEPAEAVQAPQVDAAKPEAAKVEEPKAVAPITEESKAAAPKVEEPKPESKSEAKKEAPKAAPPASVKTAGPDAEWTFVKAAAEDADAGVRDATVEDLRLFARRYPDAPQTPEALFLLADLSQKKGDWQAAETTFLRVIHEYVGASVELRAKSAYLELVDKKASRKQRAALNEMVNGRDGADKSARLAALWLRLVDKAPDALYDAVADEIREFLARFPSFSENDQLQAALARLHAANDKPAAAVVAWRKLLALHPDSALRPRAQAAIGDLYADALREPRKAIDAYQELIAAYPKSAEVQPALENCARLFEDKLKQYDLAVEMDEQIVKTFPKTPAALKALQTIARLQRERLGKPGDAVTTALRLSAMHGGRDGVGALLLAAEIARRDLKDYPREAELRRQVSVDYSDAKEAPQALYDSAGVYESDAKDGAKAIDVYNEVASKYPDHKLARKATDRAAKLAAAQ